MRAVFAVLVGIVLLICVVVGVLFFIDWRERRAVKQAAAYSLAITSFRFRLLAAAAQDRLSARVCKTKVTYYGGRRMCDVPGLREAWDNFSGDCSRCLPDDAPSATCERVERAIVESVPWDNPCQRF